MNVATGTGTSSTNTTTDTNTRIQVNTTSEATQNVSLRQPPPPRPSRKTPPSAAPQLHSPAAGEKGHVTQLPPPPRNAAKGKGENLPLLVGTAVAIMILVMSVIGVCMCVCACKRRRRKKSGGGYNYYTEDLSSGSSRPHKSAKNIYYSNGETAPWRPSLDRIVKQAAPADASTMVGPWRAPPPPPPPPPDFLLYTSSGDMSSNIFSGPPVPPPAPRMELGFQKSVFSYDELVVATGGFSRANLLGQGGFGYVHKGVLANGKEVAVKSLKAGSGQGEREFRAEVEIISRVHHRHLVSLVGYCIAGGQRMLVYEFVPNRTLEYHLHGRDRGAPMDFSRRMKIALGSAKGIAYLHEDCHPKIIHRDIKAANILLDYNFEAMVADFGLAKLCTDNNTHISTRVMGTFGYLAPEYASSGKLTEKSDVFSFGIMLLELITGRRPADTTRSMMEDTLVDWARPLLTLAVTERVFDGLVDPSLQGVFNENDMIRMAACAAACVRTSGRKRPKMIQIVRVLERETPIEDLAEALQQKPGLSNVPSFDSSDESNSQKSFPRRF